MKILDYNDSYENLLFYKINNHFIMIPTKENNNKLILNENDFVFFEKNKTYKSTTIALKLKISLSPGKYTFKDNNNYISLDKNNKLFGFCLFSKKHKNADIRNLLKIEKFRHKQKENLLNELMRSGSNINSTLESLKEYTFSCNFSLWDYNKDLGIYSCLASSFIEPGKVITKEAKTTLTQNVNMPEFKLESRELTSDVALYDRLHQLGMKSLNRLTIRYGDSKIAIATFHSKHENFTFDEKLAQRLSESIKSKLNELLERSHEKYEEFANSVRTDLKSVSLKSYADNFLARLCKHFQLYSAGIYVITGDSLSALSKYGDLDGRTELLSKISKELKSKKDFILLNDSQNLNKPDSKTAINEEIKSVLVNSFKIADIEFCLISTKKIENGVTVKLPYFYGNDSIDRAAELLKFNITLLFSHEEVIKELEQSKNFMKVWRHEIRSPISKFNLGSDLIKLLIEKIVCDEKVKRKILDQLHDIKLLGNRLKQLTDAYDFEIIINNSEQKMEKLSLLKDVILPIVNTSKDYSLKQYDIELKVNHQNFNNIYIISDIKLLNMVLNALVDNAMKYSNINSKVVNIGGYSSDENFVITVSNKGTIIPDDEQIKIFNEGVRGSNATNQNIDGTGIGLFIARKVMEALSGDVKLTQNSINCIEFSIFIPIRGKI